MSSKDSRLKTKPTQSQKFIEAARELGCDEDESSFDEMVKKVAKALPPRQADDAKEAKPVRTRRKS